VRESDRSGCAAQMNAMSRARRSTRPPAAPAARIPCRAPPLRSRAWI